MTTNLNIPTESTMQNKKWIARFLLLVMVSNIFESSVLASELTSTSLIKGNVTTSQLMKTNAEATDGVMVPENSQGKLRAVKLVRATSAGGPGQSESSGFSLTSTDGLVDKFTGDFNYSIPIADVEGYPLVLSYNSAISMNTDASWVGLGWDLNVGAVSREMRGLPDEFNGKQTVLRTFKQATANNNGWKFGGYLGWQPSTAWKESVFQLGLSAQVTALLGRYYDTYLGYGKTFDWGVQASPSITFDDKYNFGPTFGFAYSSDSKRGIGKSYSMGLTGGYTPNPKGESNSIGYSVSNEYNSRQGMTARTNSFSFEGGWNNNKIGAGGSYGASATIMYGTQTSVPSVAISNSGSANNSSLNLYLGKQFSFLNSTVKVGLITRSQSSVVSAVVNQDKQIVQPAVGYFHNGKYYNYPASDTQFPIMDFNRTGMEEYSEEMKNLAFSVQTYDIFRVNALGIGATFRARRNDFGTIQDPKKDNTLDVDGTNVNAGGVKHALTSPFTYTIEIGGAQTFGNSTTTSDIVEEEGGGQALSFTHEPVGPAFDKAVYFKGVGEMTPENLDDETLLGGNEPSYFQLAKSSNEKDVVLTNNLYTNGTTTSITSSTLNQPEELVRATSYKPYTAKEYADLGTENKFIKYQSADLNAPVYSAKADIDRLQEVTANNPNYSNHLSVIEVVNTSGMKYLFGIPAYDLNSSQVSFCARGLYGGTSVTQYSPGDNSLSNTRGTSDYFDKTVMPAVAHSFLLTEVQSPDYIDRTLDGPSLDDIGNYYKFNYTRLYSAENPYKWRFPIGERSAYISPGKLASLEDDIANYSYGEKEIWYTNSIESKNLVAEFILEDRLDACGVTDEEGVLNPASKLKLLKKIVIYNRSERMHPTTGSSAVPLRTIEFEYNYELCRNHPSNVNFNNVSEYNNSGKLTLKSIRSYSGKSEEMGLYAYNFDYGMGNVDNVDFSYETDSWGSKKEADALKPINLFPYADQVAANADKYAKSWKLKTIIMPSGGTVDVQYEADSYATVQDKRVMNHIDIEGFTNVYDLLEIRDGATWNGSTGKYTNFHKDLTGAMSGSNATDARDYYDDFGKLNEGRTPNNVVIFKLDKTIPTSATAPDGDVKKNNFIGLNGQVMSSLMLKLYLRIKPLDQLNELITTFGTIKENLTVVNAIGVLPPAPGNSFYSYGYVVLSPSIVDDKNGSAVGTIINSLQKSAIEYVRRELPDLVYGTCATCESNMFLDKAVKRNGDVNLIMQEDGWVEVLQTDKKLSTLRIYNGNNLKYGGNGRVRTITYRDNWTAMSGENQGVYVWNYKYPDLFKTSGNAASEPNATIDECDLYHWDSYINPLDKYVDVTMYTVKPLAGILLPSAFVGYEEVVVDIEGVQNKGYSKTKYYTTHQFPMLTKATAINKSVHIDEPTNALLGMSTEKFGFSQGYVVETNDFHGKIMETSVHNLVFNGTIYNDITQARSTYIYAGLNEQHSVLKNIGTMVQRDLAQETDIHADTRYIESRSVHTQVGLSLKLKFPKPTGTPPIPVVLPSFMRTESTQGFYSSALVKHINRSAILKEVETEELGSINSAKNLVYDNQTGNVLLSSLRDEYNDELYSFSYPAHWYYTGMREYAESQSKEMSITIFSDNTIPAPMSIYLTEGDYIQLLDVSDQPKVWVALNVANNSYYLMNSDGTKSSYSIISGSNNIKVLQTNRENRQDEMMQYVVTKHNPISGSTFTFPVAEIISASGITLRHRKSIKCGNPMKEDSRLTNNEVDEGEVFNPYLLGVRGDLVLDAQYSWQSERLNESHQYKTRFDGTYSEYEPLYLYTTGYTGQKWLQVWEAYPGNPGVGNYRKWRKSGVINFYDSFGNPLESKDEIKVKSAMLTGYNNMFNLVPIAQAVAARQQDIGFDGFEDYTYYSYLVQASAGGTAPVNGYAPSNDRFSYKVADAANTNVMVDNTIRHSGLSSLKITNNSSVTYTAVIDQVNHDELSPEDENGYGYLAESCDCIPGFAPNVGKYVVSGWIKVSDPSSSPGRIVVSVTGGSSPFTTNVTPTGNIIDGWRRVEWIFTIPNDANGISIKLEQTSGSAAYFDDVRIHPFNAGMTTTVYDPKTLLPLATHDAFNYTIFYNYDENNQLVRMRVETIEGIKTVSESEMSGFKQPKP